MHYVIVCMSTLSITSIICCIFSSFPVSTSILLPFFSIYSAISTVTFSCNCWRKWTDVEKCASCGSGSRIFHSWHLTAANHSLRQVSTDFNGLHLEPESMSLLLHRYTHTAQCVMYVLVFHPHTIGTLPNTATTHSITHALMHSHLHIDTYKHL